jgi:hypothetical protein
MRGWRLILGAAGILVVVYGLVQLVVNVPASSLILVVAWLIGAVIIHDGILSPAVVGIGSIMRRLVPDRGRRYLQAALIMGAIVTLIAIPMIYRQGTQPPSKALLCRTSALISRCYLASSGQFADRLLRTGGARSVG